MTEEKTVSLRKLFDEAFKKQNYRVNKVKRKKRYNSNKSGFFRVQKTTCRDCKNGFIWSYRVQAQDDEHKISRVDILRLKKDIQDMGLPWYVIDEKKARKTAREAHYSLDKLR